MTLPSGSRTKTLVVGVTAGTVMALLVVCGGSAHAGRPERLGAARAGILRLDTDHDGRLSRAEHTAAARKMFEGMDGNHDGKLTAAEIDAAYSRVKGRRPSRSMKARNMKGADRVKMFDRDGDQAISADEHSVDAVVTFDKMDEDKNGFLTTAELAANHGKALRKARPKRR